MIKLCIKLVFLYTIILFLSIIVIQEKHRLLGDVNKNLVLIFVPLTLPNNLILCFCNNIKIYFF